jgi:hypothetical protein
MPYPVTPASVRHPVRRSSSPVHVFEMHRMRRNIRQSRFLLRLPFWAQRLSILAINAQPLAKVKVALNGTSTQQVCLAKFHPARNGRDSRSQGSSAKVLRLGSEYFFIIRSDRTEVERPQLDGRHTSPTVYPQCRSGLIEAQAAKS